jgi:hypothetical protein
VDKSVPLEKKENEVAGYLTPGAPISHGHTVDRFLERAMQFTNDLLHLQKELFGTSQYHRDYSEEPREPDASVLKKGKEEQGEKKVQDAAHKNMDQQTDGCTEYLCASPLPQTKEDSVDKFIECGTQMSHDRLEQHAEKCVMQGDNTLTAHSPHKTKSMLSEHSMDGFSESATQVCEEEDTM